MPNDVHLIDPTHIELLYWSIAAAFLLAICSWLPWIAKVTTRSDSPPPIDPERQETESPSPLRKSPHITRRIFTHPLAPSAILLAVAWIVRGTSESSGWTNTLFILLSCLGFFCPLFYRPFRSIRAFAGVSALLLVSLLLTPNLLIDRVVYHVAAQLHVNPGVAVTKYQSVHFTDPILHSTERSVDFSRDRTPYFRSDDFSLEVTGFIEIEVPGEHQFFLTSDDGADLEIDGKTILSNPGYHAAQEVSAAIALQPGFHPFRIPYYNGASDAILILEWAPPGQSRSRIDSSHLFIEPPDGFRSVAYRKLINWGIPALLILLATTALALLGPALRNLFARTDHPTSPRPLFVSRQTLFNLLPSITAPILSGFSAGVIAVCLLWSWFYLPRFAPISHGLKGTIHETDAFENALQSFNGGNARMHSISHRYFKRSSFAAVFDGFLRIESPGKYRFSIQADNGSRLKIGNSVVLSAWNLDPRRNAIQTRELTAGLHRIRIEMHNEGSPAFINWTWSPPGSNRFHPVPLHLLYTESPSIEQLKQDDVFTKVRIGILTVLGTLLFTILIHLTRRRSDRTIRQWSCFFFMYPVIAFTLIQSVWMDPDFRFGLEWFLLCSIPVRLLVLTGIFLLLTPPVLGALQRFPEFCQRTRFRRSVLFLGALTLGILGQMFFTGPFDIHPLIGSSCFLLAGLLVVLSHSNLGIDTDVRLNSETMPSLKTDPVRRAVGIALFLMILFVAAFVRFYRLHELPPGLWWDEAQTGIAARDILNGNFPPVYDLRINAGSLLSFLIAGWFQIFGSSVHALRAYYASVGIITTGISFVFFRAFFPVHWSFFGMALIAISRWLFSINRVAMATIDETILLTFLVFITYVSALRTGKIRHYMLCGILIGIGLHLHTGARVLPLIIGVDLVTRVIQSPRRFMKEQFKPAFVLVLAATITFGPMALHIIRHPSDYFKRSRETLLTTEYPGYYSLPTLAENTLNYVKMYPFSGDWHPRHNHARTPQLAPAVSILVLFGFAAAWRRIRRKIDRFFLLGFALVSLQGILTVHNNTANLNRVAENIPIVHFWAVCGMVYLATGIGELVSSRNARRITSVVAAIVLVSTFTWEYRLYFDQYAKSREIVGVFGFQPELTEPAEMIRNLIKQDPDIRIFAEYIRSDSFRYIQPFDPRLFEITGGHLPADLSTPPIAIVVLDQNHDLDREVRQRFPDALMTEFDYSLIPGFTLYRLYQIRN